MDSTLRQTVCEAIRVGKLPNQRPERTWGGRGAGASCTICGEPVREDEVELELDFARGDAAIEPGNERPAYLVHLRCFKVWDDERRNFDVTGGAVPASEQTRLAAAPSAPAGAAESNSGPPVSSGVLPGQADPVTITGCERAATSGPRSS